MAIVFKRTALFAFAFLVLFGLCLRAEAKSHNESSQIVAVQMETISKQMGKDEAAKMIDLSISAIASGEPAVSGATAATAAVANSNSAPELSVNLLGILSFVVLLLILAVGLYFSFTRKHIHLKSYSAKDDLIFVKK